MLRIPAYLLLGFREGMISGCLLMIYQLLLYQAGYEYFTSPLQALGIVLMLVFISIRLVRYGKRKKMRRLFGANFGLLYTAFSVASFMSAWFTYYLLKYLDPNLNSYILHFAKSDAEDYLFVNKVPKGEVPLAVKQALVEADLTNVPTLLNNYLSSLVVGLVITLVLAYFLRSRKDILDEENEQIERDLERERQNREDEEDRPKPPFFTPILK